MSPEWWIAVTALVVTLGFWGSILVRLANLGHRWGTLEARLIQIADDAAKAREMAVAVKLTSDSQVIDHERRLGQIEGRLGEMRRYRNDG